MTARDTISWLSAAKYCIEYSMVHLNITLDEHLYRTLKARTPSKKMSAFIAEALREKLKLTQQDLDAAYREAATEPWRQDLASDWNAVDGEGWPE